MNRPKVVYESENNLTIVNTLEVVLKFQTTFKVLGYTESRIYNFDCNKIKYIHECKDSRVCLTCTLYVDIFRPLLFSQPLARCSMF